MDISKKILEELFWGMNKEPERYSIQLSILGSKATVESNNNELWRNNLNDRKFIQKNVVQPIMTNWRVVLILASSLYDKSNILSYEEGDYFKSNKRAFMNEIKPTRVWVSRNPDNRQEIGLDVTVTSDKFAELLGGELRFGIMNKRPDTYLRMFSV